MVSNPTVSTYDRVHAIIDPMVRAAEQKTRMGKHRELVALIEADRHLLIGAKAMAAHIEQRFTKDTDYMVDRKQFQHVRKWLTEQGIKFEDVGPALRCESLGIDVVNASSHSVRKEILRQETGLPSPEALAAAKYVSIVSGTREPRRAIQDASDFVGLVTLEQFQDARFLGYLVDRFEEQRPHAVELLARIRRGETPLTF
jgi:6-phosphogluconate dehydrogenase